MPARVEALNDRATDRGAIGAVVRIDAAIPVEGVATPRREAQERLDRIALGQIIPASVVAQLDDGSFMVELAGVRIRMQLPAETRIGQRLNLSLVSRTPQPSFQIEPDSPNTIASFSAGARLIESVLLAQRDTEHPPVISTSQAMLPAATTNTAVLAEALRQTIENSGLFYEAHVAAWAQGRRSLSALAQEPQQQAQLRAQRRDQPLSAEATMEGSSRESLGPVLAQLVSAQLDTLEHQRLAWQGEIWPGQSLTLETQRQGHAQSNDHADDPGGSAEQHSSQQATRVWQTALEIDLPRLGRISARLHLIGERVRIDIESEQTQTAQQLQRQREPLVRQLEAAGLGVMGLSVDLA